MICNRGTLIRVLQRYSQRLEGSFITRTEMCRPR